jgi:hypothetical protein
MDNGTARDMIEDLQMDAYGLHKAAIDRAWNHSEQLFEAIVDVTKDDRVPVQVRLEILDKVRRIVAASQQAELDAEP